MPRSIAQTQELLAINKPAGLIVHSDGRTVEPSLADWIVERYPALRDVGEPWVSPQGEVVSVCGLVHRLDRTTSGVIIAAKTSDAFEKMRQAFKERRVEKTYRAFVYGHLEADEEGTIVAEIARTRELPRRWYAIARESDHVRAAITQWRVLARFIDPASGEPVSYVEAHPLTGRTHQIRVHFASIGHPLVGDHLYAPERASLLSFSRPALHAYRMSFAMNESQEEFIAPLPEDFDEALKRFEE
ncbi:RNA pseudouridine synthase [Candidatus Kaiserbacteria bacterium]|nr:RNA pseudouridine synthase [Candidatus Kaiserbacteria bacterium]